MVEGRVGGRRKRGGWVDGGWFEEEGTQWHKVNVDAGVQNQYIFP